jgi:hypothetical protein|tara:strand:- start:544 stop:753 length:210 start_codon:yes stop_codon:yes gene_type:complete
MTKELENSLKENEMNSFIIYYALAKYAGQFTDSAELPKFADNLKKLLDKYEKRTAEILIKKNLNGGNYE